MSEFDLIDRHFTSGWHAGGEIVLGVGDDGALIDSGSVNALALGLSDVKHLTISTAIASAAAVINVPSPEHESSTAIARLAFAGAVYRLAARGAAARWLTLGLTLPQYDEVWVTEFANELKALCARHRVSLAGGDTTRGAFMGITTVCQGPRLAVDGQPTRTAALHLVRASLPSPCAVAYLCARGGQVSLEGEAAWISTASGPAPTRLDEERTRAGNRYLSPPLVYALVDEDICAHLERHWPSQFEVIERAPDSTPAN